MTWESILDRIVASLSGPGWDVIDGFLPKPLWQALAREAERRLVAGDFHAAGIGRRAQVTTAVRGDAICWLDATVAGRAEQAFLQRVEALRQALNRSLWLGLLDFECHYACYSVGAFYRRHLDQPRDRPERTVTLICYLNTAWKAEDGGALRLYLEDAQTVDVLPEGGRAVVFFSDRFEHEVLPARRPRLALTGWFRRRVYGRRVV